MSEPLIRAIMPTCNRETFGLRTVKCFQSQPVRALMVVLNSGGNYGAYANDRVCEVHMPYAKSYSVGHLRNMMIEQDYGWTVLPDYIAHFDDDDVSAPNRLSCQLAHIQKTGKLVTGFYDMPMYDSRNDKVWLYENPRKSPYALGCSLFYKREAWELHKFPDRTPEDNLWRNAVGGENIETRSVWEDGRPLMIQVVHGANASASIVRSSHYYKEPSEAQEKAIRELLAAA